MNVDELRLTMAIYHAGLGGSDRPTSAQRLQAAKRVMVAFIYHFQDSYFPYSIDDIARLSLAYRKNKDTQIKVQIALAHGWRCFWFGRGVGDCSNEVEAGHIVPKCKGGELSVENCWIECRAHNNDRKEKTIEEYLRFKLSEG